MIIVNRSSKKTTGRTDGHLSQFYHYFELRLQRRGDEAFSAPHAVGGVPAGENMSYADCRSTSAAKKLPC